MKDWANYCGTVHVPAAVHDLADKRLAKAPQPPQPKTKTPARW